MIPQTNDSAHDQCLAISNILARNAAESQHQLQRLLQLWSHERCSLHGGVEVWARQAEGDQAVTRKLAATLPEVEREAREPIGDAMPPRFLAAPPNDPTLAPFIALEGRGGQARAAVEEQGCSAWAPRCQCNNC